MFYKPSLKETIKSSDNRNLGSLTTFCIHVGVIGQKRGRAKKELTQSVHCPNTHTHTHRTFENGKEIDTEL